MEKKEFVEKLLKEHARLNTVCEFLQEEITKAVLEKKMLEEKARSGEFRLGILVLS